MGRHEGRIGWTPDVGPPRHPVLYVLSWVFFVIVYGILTVGFAGSGFRGNLSPPLRSSHTGDVGADLLRNVVSFLPWAVAIALSFAIRLTGPVRPRAPVWAGSRVLFTTLIIIAPALLVACIVLSFVHGSSAVIGVVVLAAAVVFFGAFVAGEQAGMIGSQD